jgi:hypothetical protein
MPGDGRAPDAIAISNALGPPGQYFTTSFFCPPFFCLSRMSDCLRTVAANRLTEKRSRNGDRHVVQQSFTSPFFCPPFFCQQYFCFFRIEFSTQLRSTVRLPILPIPSGVILTLTRSWLDLWGETRYLSLHENRL